MWIFFPLINKSEVYGNICLHFFTTTHRYNDRNTANTEQPVHPFSYLRTWPRGTWTPLLWPACHPHPKEAIFRAENHCLKFGCANPHPSHLTLCCKPSQCMLRVIRWGSKQNHMICWKQKYNLRATSQTHSWPWLDLEILAMKIHIGFEGAALGPTPTGNSLNVQLVNTASTFSHTRTKWLLMAVSPIAPREAPCYIPFLDPQRTCRQDEYTPRIPSIALREWTAIPLFHSQGENNNVLIEYEVRQLARGFPLAPQSKLSQQGWTLLPLTWMC